jgi:hypothetical protein
MTRRYAHSAGAHVWSVRCRLLHRRSFTPAIVLKLTLLLPVMVAGALLSIHCRQRLRADAVTAHLYRSQDGVFCDDAGRCCRDGECCCSLRRRTRADHGCTDVARGADGDSGSVLCRAFRKYRDAASACSGRHDAVADASAMLAVAATGSIFTRLRVRNRWFLGSLIGAAILGGLGITAGPVPDMLLIAAQVVRGSLSGLSSGTNFSSNCSARCGAPPSPSRSPCDGSLRRWMRILAGAAGADDGIGLCASRHGRDGAHWQGTRARRACDRGISDGENHRSNVTLCSLLPAFRSHKCTCCRARLKHH